MQNTINRMLNDVFNDDVMNDLYQLFPQINNSKNKGAYVIDIKDRIYCIKKKMRRSNNKDSQEDNKIEEDDNKNQRLPYLEHRIPFICDGVKYCLKIRHIRYK